MCVPVSLSLPYVCGTESNKAVLIENTFFPQSLPQVKFCQFINGGYKPFCVLLFSIYPSFSALFYILNFLFILICIFYPVLTFCLWPCAGLLVSHCGEVRRHAEGQGAEASAAAAGAADATTQQCNHLGESDRPGGPHSTVPGCKRSTLTRTATGTF